MQPIKTLIALENYFMIYKVGILCLYMFLPKFYVY